MRAMESSRQRVWQQLEEEQGAETSLVYDVASMPGFRFQPTEEELVGFYLRSMVVGNRLEVELINVLDLYRYDPWELPAMAFMQGEREWLFFCPRDRKYPNGARPNRVTASGYWKATGTDRQVRRAHDARCIGLKKTLVFYTGKAPRGRKTEWVMNEYRLPQNEHLLRKPTCARKDPREVALCRIYKKLVHNPALLCTTQGPDSATEDPSYYPYVDSEQASASTSGTSPSRAFAPCRRPISHDDMDVLCDTLGSCSRSVKLENSPGTVDETSSTVELALLNAQRSMFSSPDAARGVGVSVSISADRFSWLRQDVTQLPGDVGGLIDPAGCGTLSSIASMDRLLKSSMFSPTAAHSLLGADENCDIDFPLPMSSLYSSHTHMFGGSSHQPPWLQTISPAAARQTVGRSQYSAE